LTADTLVCLGTLAAYGYSAFGVVSGTGDVYFDTVAMVLVLFTLGRYLEAQGRVRAMRSLAPMLAGEQASVAVIGPDGEQRRPVATVQIGDRVRIRPGERVAVDGRVLAGSSECDESILTGQPEPCPKRGGDQVIAGSLNGNGELVVCATVPGVETRWVHIGRLVREALAQKSVLGESVDRVAAGFVPAVLALALGTAAYWAGEAGAGPALLAGLAVLVVACPCALGLAAPLATSLGIGRAARQGILIRGPAVLERLGRLRAVAFDKTGTLTLGQPTLVATDADDASVGEVLRRAQQLAVGSEHPLARAIAARATVAARSFDFCSISLPVLASSTALPSSSRSSACGIWLSPSASRRLPSSTLRLSSRAK
jgi:Cu2+-exporting ATPase